MLCPKLWCVWFHADHHGTLDLYHKYCVKCRMRIIHLLVGCKCGRRFN